MNQNEYLFKDQILNNKNISNRKWRNLPNNILYNKYSLFKYSYTMTCINNLIFNEKCRIVSRFKEYLILDDDTEFLRIYHEKKSLINNLKTIIDFYEKYNKVFPNYIILPENIFMYKNLRKKQKMIDEQNKIKKIKEGNENNISIDFKDKDNINENIIIFDDKINEKINRQNNSILSLSLTNNIIPNILYNNNDNSKYEYNVDKNYSLKESNINNSSINFSLFNILINKNNNNNHELYSDSLKSESSLRNIIDILNNKKFKKIAIIHNKNKIKNKNKNKKNNILNIDTYSNKVIKNNILTNIVKTQHYIIKTPSKNKLIKKEKDFKQIYQIHHKSLNNNRKIFNHKKNTSDFRSFGSTIKNIKKNFLTKKKTTKYINKFLKEKDNVIEEITSSLMGKYKNKQRNKNKKNEINSISHSKNRDNLKSSNDKYEHLYKKISQNIKENKIIKVNNYYAFKRINNYVKINKNNNIAKDKKRKIEEEEKDNGENNKSKTQKIYELFQAKYKTYFNNIIKEKKKGINKPTLDTDSTESTKLSFNNPKTKFKFYITCDKINNNNQLIIYNNENNTNNEISYTKKKEDFLYDSNYNTLNNFKINNYNNTVNNTDNNIGKNNQKQKRPIIENKKLFHKKHKTFSLNLINNDFYFFNKNTINNDNEIDYLNYKLKKIKEEIIKNKNNYKEINEKYRKLSEDKQKKIISSHPKKFEKMVTCSLFNNNNIEKNEKNYSKNIKNDLNSTVKIKAFKKDKNIILLHKRHYSIINNNFKNLFGIKTKNEISKKKSSK